MTLVLMFVLLGKEGAYTMARADKRVDVDYLVRVHGEGAREFLAFCKSVIQDDLTPTSGMYEDILLNMERLVRDLVQSRRTLSLPPRDYLRISPDALMAKTAANRVHQAEK